LVSQKGDFFSKMALRSAQSQYPEIIPAKNGKTRGRIGYFTGCAGNLIYTNVAKSVVDILTGYGYEVVIPKKQKCNGTPVLANGDYEGAKMLMEHNFNLFQSYDLDAIVVSCSSCGMALKRNLKFLSTQVKNWMSSLTKYGTSMNLSKKI
jgi:glycolate oxidase iron-sulfur subunit